MTQTEQITQIYSHLPSIAQQEALDFMLFLQQRYSGKKASLRAQVTESALASPQSTSLKNIGKVSEKLPPAEFESPDMPSVYQGPPLSLADMGAAVLAEND